MKPIIVLMLALALAAGACGDSSDADATPTTDSTTTTAPTTTTTVPIETSDTVTVDGAALPRFGTAPDPAVGMAAPTVAGTSFDGSTVMIEPSDGYTVVLFLAHWCPHCRDEVASLGPYFETNPPSDGIDVVGVSTGVDRQRPNYPPSEWLTPEVWPFPVLADGENNEAARAFGLNAYPFWVVLDPDGTVIGRTAGSLPLESVDALFQNLSQLEG